MGGEQAASVLSMVGTFGTEVERDQFNSRIREQYELQGSPYYSTARLWDDGIIDPLDTRAVLALGIAVARYAPILEPQYGVFRM
jgi:3-methylcrotonyl-CoA carboxylase beta subunit